MIYIENFDISRPDILVMTNKKFWYESDTELGFLEFLEKVRKESDKD